MDRDGTYPEAARKHLLSLEKDGRRKLLPTGGTISLCSNDYLGFSKHPRLVEAAARALKDYGTGSTGSRLLSGNHALNRDLESATALFKRGQAATVFTTGYQANLSTVVALSDLVTVCYSDALNHASLIDGLRLAGRETVIFPHNDWAFIEIDLDRRTKSRKTPLRFMIVTESLFSMEGDMAPLSELSRIASQRDGLLLVDEAHATGTLGKTGRGGFEAQGLDPDESRTLVTGTFSKALGCLGGFTVSHPAFRDLLISRGRGFVYSTALPPSVLASNLAAIELLSEDPSIVGQLQQTARDLRTRLHLSEIGSPILPIRGPAAVLLRFQKNLEGNGFSAPLIRPPTVPEGTERIRLSVCLPWSGERTEMIGTAWDRAIRS
jgi:8-amino-7-oxononanoate synthase